MDKEQKKNREGKTDREGKEGKEEKTESEGKKNRDEKTNQEEKRNRIFGKLFIWFIGITAVLTFFSKSLYSYRLPVVTVTSPKQGELDFSVKGTATISYAEYMACYADMDGRIKEILVEKGDRVKKGQCLMKIEMPGSDEVEEITAEEDGIITLVDVEKGMFVSYMTNKVLYEAAKISNNWNAALLVSDEEAENVKIGSKAVLKLLDKNLSLDGEVMDVIPYTSPDFTGKQVVIRLHSEDASINGEKADITINNNGTLYDTLIPVAALRKDAKGYYVLTLQEDDGVLGNGYKAARISVDLLDSDKLYCAVHGLPEGVSVIAAATSEISEGNHVYYEGGESDD